MGIDKQAEQVTDDVYVKNLQPPYPWVTVRTYKRVNGKELRLHIYDKNEAAEKPLRPAVMFFPGGGWHNANIRQFMPYATHLAARGMVAICVDYRVKVRDNVTGFGCLRDAYESVWYVKRHADELGVDAERIACAGGSAGGHLAIAMAVFEAYDDEYHRRFVSSMPSALALFNPVLDTTETGYKAAADALHQHHKRISPLHHMRKGLPPTIVFHGNADQTTPFENAERLKRFMEENGDTCDVVKYDRAGHGFFNLREGQEEWHADTLRRLDDFFVRLGYLSPSVTSE